VAEAATELSRHGATSRGYRCDVSSLDAADELGARVLADFGRVDILCQQNAGITRDRLFIRMSGGRLGGRDRRQPDGCLHMSKAFAPAMLKQRAGSIVNIASVVGQMGNAGQATTRRARRGSSASPSRSQRIRAARRSRQRGRTGFIRTAMTTGFRKMWQGQMKQIIPLGRFGEPGMWPTWWCSWYADAAGYVTGQSSTVTRYDNGALIAARV